MSTKTKLWVYAIGFQVAITALFLIFIARGCKGMPDAQTKYRVHTERGFSASIDIGMQYLNNAAGCNILVRGTQEAHDILFLGMLDTPCEVGASQTGLESGHTAGTYQCPKTGKWHIDVEAPGGDHLMVCIAMHEILHVLGFQDGGHGLMDMNYKCGARIWPSDDETAKLKALCTD